MKELSHTVRYECRNVNLESTFHTLSLRSTLHSIIYYDAEKIHLRYPRHHDPPKIDPPSFARSQIHVRWDRYTVYINQDRVWFTSNQTRQQDMATAAKMVPDILSHLPICSDLIQECFRFTVSYPLTRPWHACLFAHLISTHPVYRQRMSYSESQQPISSKTKRMIYMAHSDAVLTINANDANVLLVRMSNTSSRTEAESIFASLKTVFKDYDDHYDEMARLYRIPESTTYSTQIMTYPTRIGYLRSMVPDLFISGYSRECPVLPILITDPDEALHQSRDRLVIRYPLDSGYYYTAPDGYYVSLKKNRLKNRDTYPYLINCYREDHRLRPNSHLNQYYFNTSAQPSRSSLRKSSHLPSNLRFSVPCHCVPITATPPRMTQELDPMPVDASSIKADLLLLETNSSNIASVVIPKHIHPYIWRQQYDRCIIIIQSYRGAYGVRDLAYDMVVKDGGDPFFSYHDPTVAHLVAIKKSHCIETPRVLGESQYIDENHKCVAVKRDDGWTECIQEPLDIPTCPLDAISDLVQDVQDAFDLGLINPTQYHLFTQTDRLHNECYIVMPRPHPNTE